MIKAMSTFVYVRERLHPGLLDELVRAGAEAFEIFAFLDAGRFTLAPEPVDVVGLVEDAITAASNQLREKGLST